MTRPPARSGGARRVRCRCGQTVLRQVVGHRLAVDVTADAEPMSPAVAYALREPNRLDWCLRRTAVGLDLRWADCHRSSRDCPHPHVIQHKCTAPAVPARPAPRRTRKPQPVPPGQLTL
ncbi:hypothetical protein [Streptomyces sp. C1-2]|uniref:hypothetical protein n=1 Tax=Streptomyces sp. C1-2 TaxID=2720022 RepID=UPI00143232D7|nr:hypothetical protein [Streptomyces sp. C1-2]